MQGDWPVLEYVPAAQSVAARAAAAKAERSVRWVTRLIMEVCDDMGEDVRERRLGARRGPGVVLIYPSPPLAAFG